ncbi:MAG: polyketide synthase, partial [Desulfobacterales bacterium]|nr:polyketide synthase [Desulfobacterales bacterium]
MEDTLKKSDQLSPLQRAVIAMKKMRSQLDAFEKRENEPIAVISMGCRFPGNSNNPEAFWDMLHNGKDAIIEVPEDRWKISDWYDPDPGVPGKITTRYGSFIKDIDQFDPQFFGISPKEAITIDPQQRLLLEVAWETLERTGNVPNRLKGSFTGVFIGVSTNEYAQLLKESNNPDLLDIHLITGNVLNAIAGRLAFIFGFNGPAIAIDTACSSSLTAIHLACQSLRNHECDLALSGGVNIMLMPTTYVSLSKAKMLSPDGRCKTFSAKADGYGRGEGCGLVLLKRLSDAKADGDNILCVIKGSAVNQDGASSGFTVPNGISQQALLRQSLANAKVNPEEVSYIEAHGTGTPMGDPIEVNAICGVMGDRRLPNNPLIIGSVKTNIGHLEAAAGIAALIKVILSLQHEEIPPHLYFNPPSSHIPWDKLPIIIPTKPISWPAGEKTRIAGISSFGATGTNVHIIIADADKGKICKMGLPPKCPFNRQRFWISNQPPISMDSRFRGNDVIPAKAGIHFAGKLV